MNKKLLLVFAAIFSCSAAFAQTDKDSWKVYDFQTREERTVDLTEQMIPAAIVGKDDRQNITGRANSFDQAAVVLEMKDYRGHSFLCSGAMVGPKTVLTAAHCLTYNGKLHKSVRVIAVGLPGGGNNNPQRPPKAPRKWNNPSNPDQSLQGLLSQINKSKRRSQNLPDYISQIINSKKPAVVSAASDNTIKGFPSAQAAAMWVPSQWDDRKDLIKGEPYDYGIVILDSNLGEKTGWMNLSAKSAKELQGRPIILLGRGGDKPSRTLWKAEGKIGRVEKAFLYHNADMVGGNSGGPVVLKSDPTAIVALNNFGYVYRNDRAPEGTYPNGCLRISDKIIKVVNANR